MIIDLDKIEKHNITTIYTGTALYNYLVSVVKIVESGELSAEADADNKTQSPIIQFKHLQNNSCLLKKTDVRQVIQIDANEFVISKGSALLILKNFQVCANIIDPVPTNYKSSMHLVPHYD